MTLDRDSLLLVTGATGLVGGAVAARAAAESIPVRAIVRATSDTSYLDSLGVACVVADFGSVDSLRRAADGATHIVHAAAKVGDWGDPRDYIDANVGGTQRLVDAVPKSLRRFVHISSLGVYPARDHHGTDETAAVADGGIDGYTRSKIEAEQVVREAAAAGLPAVLLRPGFVYGPRDQTVIPRIIERVRDGKFAYLGSGDQLLNNVYVENLADAIFLALVGDYNEIVREGLELNVTDPRLVSKREFIGSIAEGAGLRPPSRQVPLPLARLVARGLEAVWRWRGKQEAPLLSQARIKFLGLNLDFSSERARRCLGYDPQVDFEDAMRSTMQEMMAGERAGSDDAASR